LETVARPASHRAPSTVARLVASCRDPLRRNPRAVLHEHFRWPEAACEHGARVVLLQVYGSYVINTAENHSELHGPFAAWRLDFGTRAGCEGRALDADFAARFGLYVAKENWSLGHARAQFA
jgi:hypothetical protein